LGTALSKLHPFKNEKPATTGEQALKYVLFFPYKKTGDVPHMVLLLNCRTSFIPH
jgi:hypothetical protein